MRLKPRPFAKPSRGHQLSKGLVGYWLMNEGAGNKVYDLSGNGKTGTLNGSPVWTPSKFGSGIQFVSGDSDYISSPTVALSGIDRTFVISFFNDGNTEYEGVFLRTFDVTSDQSKYHTGIGFVNNNPNYVRAMVGNGTNYTAGTKTLIGTNVWVHIVAVIRGGQNIKIFVDGIEKQSDATTYSPYTTAIGIYIGRLATKYLDSRVDHAMIYNRALSAQEVAELYIRLFCMFERKARTALMMPSVGAPPVGNAGIMTANAGYWGPTF